MTKNIIIGALVVVAFLGGLAVGSYSSGASFGAAGLGPNHTSAENFLQGLYAGTLGQLKISNSGALTIGSSGTAVSNYRCATTTWNPGSLATSTITNATSTDIALPGSVAGDICTGSLTSATSTSVAVDCNIASAATGTLQITNLGISAAAIDLATGTAKVCYSH